jgi:hypothetical protein
MYDERQFPHQPYKDTPSAGDGHSAREDEYRVSPEAASWAVPDPQAAEPWPEILRTAEPLAEEPPAEETRREISAAPPPPAAYIPPESDPGRPAFLCPSAYTSPYASSSPSSYTAYLPSSHSPLATFSPVPPPPAAAPV